MPYIDSDDDDLNNYMDAVQETVVDTIDLNADYIKNEIKDNMEESMEELVYNPVSAFSPNNDLFIDMNKLFSCPDVAKAVDELANVISKNVASVTECKFY